MKRFFYYLQTVHVLITSVQNWWMIPAVVFYRPVLRLRNGLMFRVRSLHDVLAVKEVCIDRVYEQRWPVGKNWVVVDIGGGIGDFSIMHDVSIKKLVCYEPDPLAAMVMEENMSINDCRRIRLCRTPARSLARILSDHHIQRCDLVKIDCEGCEYRLLLNASRLTLRRIRRLAIEYHLFSS